MANANTTTYATLEDAKVACEWANAECKTKGEGKERFVFDITVKGEHQFYVVATLSGKARAIAALALDIKASVAERKTPQPQKSIGEQLATMKPDELARIRELLAQLEAPATSPTPASEGVGEGEAPDAGAKAKKGKPRKE